MSKTSFKLKEKLIAALIIGSLMMSCFIASVTSTQPPVNTSTYLVGTIGQPARMDPARAYDTASGEVIQNIAQTLIWWNDKPVVTFTPGVGHNLTVSEYANLDSYGPVLATALPVISNNYTAGHLDTGEYYTFTINTNARFQPWTAANGSIIPARNLTAADVVYSFQRQMIYDSYYAPTWMWFGPAFVNASAGFSTQLVGGPFSTWGNGTFRNSADELSALGMIASWCYVSGINQVSFHFQNPWAPGILNQIFAQTWGSILEPEWVKEHGGWDGNLNEVGWSNLWHLKPTSTRSEIDAWKDPAIYGPVAGSKYPSSNKHINELMGTGPYLFTSWDQVNSIWRIDAWNSTNSLDGSSYWANPTWAGSHVLTVIEKGVNSWPTRKMLFLEGEFDVAVVPRANMYDLLVTDAYHPSPGINLVYNVAQLSNDMMFFCMNVTGASAYQSYVGYPTHQTGAEYLFFANDHMRKAFAWAINYTQYIQQAYFGEALQQASWWVDGLSPPSFKNTALTLRNLDTTQMQNELNAAVVDGINVGSAGFETTLLYNIGNDQRMIAEQLIASAFQTLGAKYKVNVVGLDWPVFLDAMNSKMMPVFCLGWLADFADSHDFAQPYMQSTGNFPISQGPPFPADQATIDAEIDAAVIEANVTQRMLDYQDLQARFYNDAITLPLIQPVGRRFARDWVQGWYFNALYPGLYAYDLYKSVASLQNVDVDMTNTVSPSSPTPPTTEIFHNAMIAPGGSGGGVTARILYAGRPDVRQYYLHVVYAGGGAIATLYISVGCAFATGGNKQFFNGTYIALAPGGAQNVSLSCWADGTTVVMTGNVTGVPYAIDGEAYPINSNALDTNPGNNVQTAGILTAKTLPGDINGDCIVDIYDAILLAGAFGSGRSEKKYNADADLNGDGFVDIYDAIILAGHFNQHVP